MVLPAKQTKNGASFSLCLLMECLSFDSRAYNKYKHKKYKSGRGEGQKMCRLHNRQCRLFLPYRYMYQLPKYNKNMRRIYVKKKKECNNLWHNFTEKRDLFATSCWPRHRLSAALPVQARRAVLGTPTLFLKHALAYVRTDSRQHYYLLQP